MDKTCNNFDMRFSRTFILCLAIMALGGCAHDVQEDGKTVKTAKACQRAKESNPTAIAGFHINACTNNGVWMVDQYDEAGRVIKRFDFLNGEYAGPESMGEFIPAATLGPEAPARLQSIRQALNSKLLDAKS